MTLTIFGIPASRTVRTLWIAAELGLDYELVPIDHRDASAGPAGKRNPAFLRASPLGRIPAIDDDGFTLFESMAIDLYLARKHGGGLWPGTLEGEALAFQWSFFAVTEVEQAMNDWAAHTFVRPEAERDAGRAAAALERLARPLAVLDEALGRRAHLAGEEFTVADLNCAAAMFRARRMDLGSVPRVARWLATCLGRPAARQALALRGE